MKPLWILALFAILVSPAFAKQKPNADKPLSSYMRRVGLMYLEEVDTLTYGDNLDRRNAWEKLLDSIEDRITIALSESERPSGDEPFFELLKKARFAHYMYMRCDAKDCSLWGHSKALCEINVHDVALDGVLPDKYLNECTDAIAAAIEQKEQKK